jgi:phosphate transport system substrate-binding protein
MAVLRLRGRFWSARRELRSHALLPQRKQGVQASLALLLAACILQACTSPALITPAPARVRIAGSTSLRPALTELAAAYQAQHPNVLVDVRGGDSASGIEELRRDEADLAAVSWLPPDQSAPEGSQAAPIARDAIAVIIHPSNPITDVTILQLRALYRGEVLDWGGLTGAASATGAEPVLVSREEGSGTRAAFEALVMGGDRVTLNALVMPTSAAVVEYVAEHRNAIGYVSLAALDPRVTAVPVEGVAPTAATLQSGEYYLIRTLYLYMPARPSAAAQSFLDFVLSPAGQQIIGKHHAPIR